ncbi:hypothetical protein CHU98_g11787 [Xylaria longipes]|nr:hypothetical protein CHU98_g11787 [Xylaria longipes]
MCRDIASLQLADLSHDANIIFASESVVDILGYQPQEIQGKSCFDYFHPDEIPFARSVHSRGVLLDKAAVLHYARILSKDGRFPTEREPRAALILNRFTRTLTIMFATNAVSSILGIGSDQLRGRSLYECIAENCWSDAIKCLENAKANDSIAYLRFWSRDPRVEENSEGDEGDLEMEDLEDETSENHSDGGVRLNDIVDVSTNDGLNIFTKGEADNSRQINQPMPVDKLNAHGSSATPASQSRTARTRGAQRRIQTRRREPIPPRELEAVVSCTSDGLVMVLRKARPPIPSLHLPMLSADFENKLFAGPWNERPIGANYPTNLLQTFNHIFHSNTRLHESMPNQLGGRRVANYFGGTLQTSTRTWNRICKQGPGVVMTLYLGWHKVVLRGYDLSKAFPGSIVPCEDTIWVYRMGTMSKMRSLQRRTRTTHHPDSSDHHLVGHSKTEAHWESRSAGTRRESSLVETKCPDGCEEAGDQYHQAVLIEMASSSHQYSSPHVDDEDDLIDPDDADLNDFDDPLSNAEAQRAPLTGNISGQAGASSSSSRPLNESYLTSRIPGDDRRARRTRSTRRCGRRCAGTYWPSGRRCARCCTRATCSAAR